MQSLKERLSVFLAANPEASYQEKDGHAIVEKPWGDSSILLTIRSTDDTLIAALNTLRLPPRFSAIWHRESKQMEFIWDPVDTKHHLRTRGFEFTLDGQTLHCRFGDSSPELLAIARAASFVRGTYTNYRNLSNTRLYLLVNEQGADVSTTPTSFWLGPMECDENAIALVGGHLNFFMTYFDFQTPRVLLHESPAPGLVKEQRYPRGPFPTRIDGRRIDPNLLLVWESVFDSPDSFRKFLYAYQVLEYRAFYYVQDNVLRVIKRVLASPDTIAKGDEAVRQMFDVLTEQRMGDDSRVEAVLKQFVDPAALWPQIALNLPSFTEEVSFDGGFALEPFLKQNATLETFQEHWPARFAKHIRTIRNSLVHGRESRQAVTIAPTRSNYERLRPWVAPIVIAAQEATLFFD